jgi:hypothetical protein
MRVRLAELRNHIDPAKPVKVVAQLAVEQHERRAGIDELVQLGRVLRRHDLRRSIRR